MKAVPTDADVSCERISDTPFTACTVIKKYDKNEKHIADQQQDISFQYHRYLACFYAQVLR